MFFAYRWLSTKVLTASVILIKCHSETIAEMLLTCFDIKL